MISTSGILSTGEKKCMPMKSSGRFTAPESSVIGSVEVFEASSASGFTTSCTSAYTLALSEGSSKTASMTESQPARSAGSAVGVMRARISAFFSSLILPRATCLSRTVAEYALPFSAASMLTSLSTTSMPERAAEYAMPAPIIPAPSTPSFVAVNVSTPSGRSDPELIACRSKKNAWIMFFEFWPTISLVR